MPFFSGGSVLNIMKFGYPQVREPAARARRRDALDAQLLLPLLRLQGLEEPVIATIIDAVLKALSYFHRNGNIHRDIKVCVQLWRRPRCVLLTHGARSRLVTSLSTTTATLSWQITASPRPALAASAPARIRPLSARLAGAHCERVCFVFEHG